ncbi:MAG: diaminopropionate ammonia-lyase [Hyphomicrobiales bacterium]|nr:diaminopropionate ammonia-lyase [Hyphomicrobiales bacterium]
MLETFESSSVAHMAATTTTGQSAQSIITQKDFADAAIEISSWQGYQITPLYRLDNLARELNLGSVYYKDEGPRFDVGSFKALGAAYAGLRVLQRQISKRLGKNIPLADLHGAQYAEQISDVMLVAATDGNHGRSLAWGAGTFGAPCKIYIHKHVSQNRAAAIAQFGAQVVRVDGDYDHSVNICREEADKNGWFVVSDTSWEGYTQPPKDVMAGYGIMANEIDQQLDEPPTHIFIQGGVGGLAAALAARLKQIYQSRSPRVIIVEPELAPCLFESARNGCATNVEITRETQMAGLSCGEPSILAWRILGEEVRDFLTIPETLVAPAVRLLARPFGDDPTIVAGESAIAGLAGLIAAALQPELKDKLALGEDSKIQLIGSEGATDQAIYDEIING